VVLDFVGQVIATRSLTKLENLEPASAEALFGLSDSCVQQRFKVTKYLFFFLWKLVCFFSDKSRDEIEADLISQWRT
jgi:hypothetical protein